MLEGKELEGNIGSVGNYYVDANDKGVLEAGVAFKIDLLAELAKVAKKTKTEIDDEIVGGLMKLLGRTEEEVRAAFA